MQCPKCQSPMETIVYEEIEVERCLSCYGLWFDALKKDDLKNMNGSEVIDIGKPAHSRQRGQDRKINCPKCHVSMISMIDKDQFHIHYESCPSCFGTFFDAGEFTDLKQHTVLQRFRQFFNTLRSNI